MSLWGRLLLGHSVLLQVLAVSALQDEVATVGKAGNQINRMQNVCSELQVEIGAFHLAPPIDGLLVSQL